MFLKRRPGGTQSALSFGVEAFKGLFCLNILLQEREAPNQTFLKHEFQVALKEQFVWFPSHPVPAQWGLGHWALGFGGGSTPFQAHCPVSPGGSSAPAPARGPLVTAMPPACSPGAVHTHLREGRRRPSVFSCLSSAGHTLIFELSLPLIWGGQTHSGLSSRVRDTLPMTLSHLLSGYPPGPMPGVFPIVENSLIPRPSAVLGLAEPLSPQVLPVS